MKVTQKFKVEIEIDVEYDMPDGVVSGTPYSHITGYTHDGKAVVVIPEGKIVDINFKNMSRIGENE